MRLLLVDDEKSILSAMQAYLQTRGHEVVCASEREEAEALLSHGKYACVILDLKLSPLNNADGLDIVRICRDLNPETRTIVLTAYGTQAVQAEAMARGADAFVKKPVSLAELASLAETLVEPSP